METKKTDVVVEERNLIKFNKMFIGSAEGVSKKGNEYCMVKFLDINKYGNGDVITLSVDGGKLPAICEDLVCGDVVEVILDVQNMIDTPVLVDITKKISDSLIYKKKV